MKKANYVKSLLLYGLFLLMMGCTSNFELEQKRFREFMSYEMQGQRFDPFMNTELRGLPVFDYVSSPAPAGISWANLIDGYRIVKCYKDTVTKVVVEFEIRGTLVPQLTASDSSVVFIENHEKRMDTVVARFEKNTLQFEINFFPMIGKEGVVNRLSEIKANASARSREKIEETIRQLASMEEDRQ